MSRYEEFEKFLKKERRSAGTIAAHMETATEFSAFQQKNGRSTDIDQAQPEEIEAFVAEHVSEGGSAKGALWSLHNYYRFSGNKSLYKHAVDLRLKAMAPEKKRRSAPKLDVLADASAEALEALRARGIKTTKQLLPRVASPEDRKKLALECAVPQADIDDLAFFADLSRITDIKGARGRFLLEGGIRTIAELRGWDPQELLAHLTDVASAHGRRAPTHVETKYWVDQAKKLPDIVTID